MIGNPLAARRALIIAPHPDDEAIGAWALMRHLRRSGATVELLIVTDGAASHPDSCAWPRSRLVPERRRETRRAMAALAIPPGRIEFLMLPDGELTHHADRLDRAIACAVRRRRRPDLIVGPMQDDAHRDHRVVAASLARLRRRGELRLGYRVWPEGRGVTGNCFRIGLDGAAMMTKRRIVRSYRTQDGRITDAKAGFTLTTRHLRSFVRPAERFEWLV